MLVSIPVAIVLQGQIWCERECECYIAHLPRSSLEIAWKCLLPDNIN